MIPSVVGREVRETIQDFLRTRYRITTPALAQALDQFIRNKEAIQGSYLSFQLPFVKSTLEGEPFPEIPLGFPPYLHQTRAFERLGADPPKPTIVATGTGSGKTESFLLPILDYCRQTAGQSGIKAILIYPMNALAADQAKRIARLIFQTPSLKAVVTAGLYVGGLGASSHSRMTESNIISDRHKLRESPPDLLLTNYKMLDYLLIRPKDKPLWEKNHPDTLRYVVVDELHTFDGAQGTDLACLLRRLKTRLQCKTICPVGTSATLGTGSSDQLREYARTIFDAEFDDNAIITEARLDPRDYLTDLQTSYVKFPTSDALLRSDQFESSEAYLQAQYKAWFGGEVSEETLNTLQWRQYLGRKLHQHGAFKNLVQLVGPNTLLMTEVAGQWRLPGEEDVKEGADHQLLLESLLSLVSHARDPKTADRPLLDVRIQFWMRELKRMVVSVDPNPRLAWDADLASTDSPYYLPLASCIKCGTAGWVTAQETDTDPFITNLEEIYRTYFSKSAAAELKVIYPGEDLNFTENWRLCPECLQPQNIRATQCSDCSTKEAFLPVHIPSLKFGQNGKPECPHCGESNQPNIFGAGGATLLSAALGQTFLSRYNDDKKVLTFSDSVQDAAHRAGYFEARTYTFSVRTAILQYLKTLNDDQDIETIANMLVQSQREDLGDADFVGTFIAPNMDWMDDYGVLVKRGTLPENSNLPYLVAERLKWEVFDNLGLRARRGRTLENTHSAAVSVDQNLLRTWTAEILPAIRGKYHEGLGSITEQNLIQFLTGLLYRLRTGGGISHPALKDYIQGLGKNKLYLQQKWAPRFKPNSPRHGFLSTKSMKNFLPLTGSRNNSWVQGWGHKCLVAEENLTPAGFDAALKDIIDAAPAGILKPYSANQHTVWGVAPNKLTVTTKVTRFACETCSYDVSVPAQDHDIWHAMPCMIHKCQGQFKIQADYDIDYYRTLYGAGDVCRFVPKEHTGLLTAGHREEIEKTFMRKDRHPWDPNIVSCTPTLELGIDIGDLSTVFLCSIPPSQANYVQRIGRAGRKDGNSFGFAVATNQPHDLYFFAEPQDMISGEVTVPGVFLKAPAVLERQMAAYSLDMWVAHSKNAAVPDNLRIILSSLANEDDGKFPFNWLNYVTTHADELAQGFKELFGNLQPELLESLTHFFYPDASSKTNLRYRVTEAFIQQYAERRELHNRIERLSRRIKDYEHAPRDENYEKNLKDLQNHRAGLRSLRFHIGDKEVFNFLSDEGILPNYAFPQSSVQLHSTILQRKEKEQQKPLTETFERPGQRAIREFAPGNHFYANGKKVRISGIRFDKNDIQTWRFCPDCSWHEPESEERTAKCPQCNSDGWGDMGQTLKLVRLSTARSTSHESNNRIDDRRDERQHISPVIRTHVKFDPEDVKIAYKARHSDVPFGFDFIQGAAFTFINHGDPSSDGSRVRIAGEEEIIAGFRICTECGRVELENETSPHEYYCRYRDKDKEPRVSLSLYHNFESECIRILLPVVDHTETGLQAESFSAALFMGLKEHFRGQVNHLQTITQDAPVPGEEIRRTFIYLYDTVPGGTGHLRDLLTDKTILEKVLRSALDDLKKCRCKEDPDKDGCYRCLFAYRNSFHRGAISREVAIDILESIVNKGDGLDETRSLDDIPVHPLVDSALEQGFLEHLKKWHSASLAPIHRGTDKLYELKVGNEIWTVECQVLLDQSKGVQVPSKPDFLLTPNPNSNALPVAVFTDGFEYHRDQFADDTLKRMAILASGRYLVWSLTWNDLKQDEPERNGDLFPLDSRRSAFKNFDSFIKKFESDLGSLSQQNNVKGAGSFDLLKAYMTDPNPKKWQALAYCHAVLNVIETASADELSDLAPEWFMEDCFMRKGARIGAYWIRDQKELHTSCVAVNLANSETIDPAALRVFAYIDDRAQSEIAFRPIWNGFLRAMNLFQFIHPRTGFFCASGIQRNEHYEILGIQEIHPGKSNAWSNVLNDEVLDSSYLPLLEKLADHDAPAPEIYFEITNPANEILTTAEIAWPAQNVALLYGECWEDRSVCERDGWNCFELEKLTAINIPEILKLLDK